MAYSTKIPPRRTADVLRGNLPPATVQIALWRLRQTWGLLFVIGLGMIAAVMLVCVVPLYSTVAMTAGLRGALVSSNQNADILVRSSTVKISATIINDASQQIDQEFQSKLGSYLLPQQLSIVTPVYPLLAGKPGTSSLHETNDQIQFVSTPVDQAPPHLHLLQGRLPQYNSNNIEVALTAESASLLKAHVGSTLATNLAFVYIPVQRVEHYLPLRVVGIFNLPSASDPFWHGEDFLSVERGPFRPGNIYTALVSSQAFISTLSDISSTRELNGLVLDGASTLLWYYRFNIPRISIDDLDAMLNGVRTVQVDTSNNFNLDQFPYLDQTQVALPSDMLQRYSNRVPIARIPVFCILFLILGLVLFFISMMADLLVERQLDAIAILRSRGASRGQLFGALTTQSIALGLIALVAGPLLAISIVPSLVQNTLSQQDQQALNVISGNPLLVAFGLRGYALAAAGVVIIAMVFAVSRAVRFDVLALRRESARSTRRPLWERLNLDIIAIIVMLAGYAFSIYLTGSGVLDVQLRLLLLSPLTLVGSVCLLIAAMLLFLRLFPLLLQLGARVAGRGTGATPLLALAQVARAPRHSIRMTLLLALATAFTIFTLVFTATQSQRVIDVAAYQSGADFGGILPNPYEPSVLAAETSAYSRIPGVTSATLGYTTTMTAAGSILALPVELRAVDTNTFARTAIWTQQDSSPPLKSLAAQLSTRRSWALSHLAIPAVVDSTTWNALNLAPDKYFRLATPDSNGALDFIVIAQVQNIPTISDSSVGSSASDYVPAGGVLVDFQSYAAVYAQQFKDVSSSVVQLNYAWLRTKSDPASVTSVRRALNVGNLQLQSLYDRRAIIENLQSEPLYLALAGVLLVGTVTAMLLAIMGNLIASWLNARRRLTSFALLRALGGAQRQVAGVLLWEQSIIYTTAIVLGILFGALLAAIVLPSLTFTSVSTTGAGSDISSGAFYVAQNVPPIQIVIPLSLFLALAILVAICIIAIGMMVRIVSRPSLSQTLRLNED